MIISSLKHSKRIEPLHPLFKELFDYVKNNDLLNMPTGRIELKGSDLFINNVEAKGIKLEDQPLEQHKDYIDVHILLQGEEAIGWKSEEKCRQLMEPYDSEKDCALYSDRGTAYITLNPGDFMIVYPEDPHAPLIGNGKIRKLIAKIRI